jgi:hypothetical protein
MKFLKVMEGEGSRRRSRSSRWSCHGGRPERQRDAREEEDMGHRDLAVMKYAKVVESTHQQRLARRSRGPGRASEFHSRRKGTARQAPGARHRRASSR